jgi:hypothetical protein
MNYDNFKIEKFTFFLWLTKNQKKQKRTLEKIQWNGSLRSNKLNETNFNVDEIPHTV